MSAAATAHADSAALVASQLWRCGMRGAPWAGVHRWCTNHHFQRCRSQRGWAGHSALSGPQSAMHTSCGALAAGGAAAVPASRSGRWTTRRVRSLPSRTATPPWHAHHTLCAAACVVRLGACRRDTGLKRTEHVLAPLYLPTSHQSACATCRRRCRLLRCPGCHLRLHRQRWLPGERQRWRQLWRRPGRSGRPQQPRRRRRRRGRLWIWW